MSCGKRCRAFAQLRDREITQAKPEKRSRGASATRSTCRGIWRPGGSIARRSKHISRMIRRAGVYRISMFCRAFPRFSLSSSHSRRVFASSAADRSGRSDVLSVSRPPYRNMRLFDREDARRDGKPSSTSTPTAGVTHPRTERNSTMTTTSNGSDDGLRDMPPKKIIKPRRTVRPRRTSRREFCDTRTLETSSSEECEIFLSSKK